MNLPAQKGSKALAEEAWSYFMEDHSYVG